MCKTLKTIQTLGKIGKILSKIAFVFALVGACACAVGLICLPFGSGEILKIGGVTLYGLMDVEPGEGAAIAAAALSGWLIVCAGEAVLAKFAQLYFENELDAGTPFTLAGAKELLRLGILTIAIPLGSAVVAEIVQGIVAGVLDVTASRADISFDNGGSVTLGVMFLVMSLLCRYGAELSGGAEEPDRGGAQPAAAEARTDGEN